MIRNEDMPMGFTMALAQHTEALEHFAKLSDEERQRVIDRAKQMNSKAEMRNYVENIFHG